MQCRNCGTEIAGKALICYRCGTATTEAKFKPAALPSQSSSSRVRWIVIVLVLLALAGLAFLLLRGDTPELAEARAEEYGLHLTVDRWPAQLLHNAPLFQGQSR